jgi:hypothetical protein
MRPTASPGTVALAAAALVPALAGCSSTRADGATPPHAATPVASVTPRPPGPPTYYPDPHYVGPNPVDASARVTATPYSGVTLGSRVTIVLTLTNPGRVPVRGLSPRIGFGGEVIATVVDAGGGTVQRIDNHDPTSNARHPYLATAVEFALPALKPGTTSLKVVIEVVDVACPGGGDFITEVSGAIGHVVKPGRSTGGRHLVWVENDAIDYAKARAARGLSDTAPPHAVCRPQSVE